MEPFVNRDGQTYHVHRLRVRYADTDRMDMVYHGTYAAYLEAARVEMLRDSGWVYAELEKAGTLLPVVQLNLTYKKPARYDQVLESTRWCRTAHLQNKCFVRFGTKASCSCKERVVRAQDAKEGRSKCLPEGLERIADS